MPTPMVIDFHAHAFDDALAAKAIPFLEEEGNVKAATDGRVASLLASMDRAGIDRSVVCPIATKPTQFEGIRRWALAVRAAHPRIEMLLSIHPADPDALARVDQAADDGFKGLKFHPYYQQFVLDDPRLFPLYERIAARGLFAVFHTGFDIAYPMDRVADPVRVRRVADAIPAFKLVATHLGGWRDWDEARRHLIGQPIFIETSYSLHELPRDDARALLLDHPADRILFGTDSPWHDQAAELARWRALDLPPERLHAALGLNAARLLNP
jgi:uncharacterized protein